MAEKYTTYRYGEGETGDGQVVHFTAATDDFELARDALIHFKDITIPSSAVVNVEHGGYGRYSRYEIEQVEYGGGQNEAGGGYYEILNIKNAPEGRHSIVSHGYMATGEWVSQFFAEWETVEDAREHWRQDGRGRILAYKNFEEIEDISQVKGLLRVVNTGYLSPWFYATGDAALVGDYVFPEHLNQDPVFAFGKQFLVPEKMHKFADDYVHVLKTCMGCVVEKLPDRSVYDYHASDRRQGLRTYRLVQWHDGTTTKLYPSTPGHEVPVPLADNDSWVTDAQRQFNEMLAGRTTGFEVQFANGGKFVGRYVPPAEQPRANAAGDYNVVVTLDNGETMEGWVYDFTPTDEEPTIAAHVERRLAKGGKTAVRIETTDKKTPKGSKKWPGVYHSSLTAPVETSELER